ncbi:MAG: hypothetical protein COC15_03190 [Legionellales bacterium]|nr:MAG: hypothetical protein COC15_03190 [Legionellales bacterium]
MQIAAVTYRRLWLVCLVLSSAAIFVSYFLEHFYFLDLCLLCTLQRGVCIGLSLVCLIAYSHNCTCVWGRYLYGCLILIITLAGLGLSVRLVWIQSIASNATAGSCAAGIKQILEFYPWAEATAIILRASNCAAAVFTLLGVPLAIWTLLLFVVLFGVAISAIFQFWERVPHRGG